MDLWDKSIDSYQMGIEMGEAERMVEVMEWILGHKRVWSYMHSKIV